MAKVVVVATSLVVALAAAHETPEKPLVLLQVRADYASGDGAQLGNSSTEQWFFTPGGSTIAVVAATYKAASAYIERTLEEQAKRAQQEAEQAQKEAEQAKKSAKKEANQAESQAEHGPLPMPHTLPEHPSFYTDRQGLNCSSCVAEGRVWCTEKTLNFFGSCGGVRSEAQCFADIGSCPALRVPSVPTHSPSSFLVGSTHPDGRPEWDNTPLVDVNHKFIFCEIPKVACTDFKRLFRRLRGADDYESQAPWVHDPKQNGILRLTDLPQDKARDALSDPAWTKALFVRDPLERLLSGFLDKCRAPDTRYDIHCPFTGEVSFGTFMKYIFKKAETDPHGTMSMDEHWRPQHLVCDLERWLPHYQFQGNFSQLRTHTKFLLQGLGLFEEFGRGWGNDSGDDLFEVKTDWHHTDTSEKLKKYYSRELADLALNFYKKDYEMFSLPIPSWYNALK